MSRYMTSDIDAVWPGREVDEYAAIAADVEDAETLLDARFPRLAGRVEAGSLSIEAVSLVVRQMVSRALASDEREGATRITLPEFGVDFDTGGGAGRGSRLFITTDELLMLNPRRGAFSNSPRYSPWTA